MNKTFLTTLSFIVLSSPQISAASEFSVAMDSKYVSEGRDNLRKGGAAWFGATHNFGNALTGSVLYGVATDSDVDYDELNLTLQKGWKIGELNGYAYFNRLEYFEGNAHDNEFGLGLNHSILDGINTNAEFVYNTATDGRFLSLNVSKAVYQNGQHTLTPHAQIGFDDGYASNNHTGYNHTAVGLTYKYQLNTNLAVSLFAEHNLVGSQIKSEGRDDISWLKLSLVGVL